MIPDLRYAIRTLRRTPGFTVAAVLCIALGIGANTAIFSLIEAALLRPLPVPDPHRLALAETVDQHGEARNFSYPQFTYVRDRAGSIALAAYTSCALNLAAGDLTDSPAGEIVSENFFSVLGVQPTIGRAFAPGEPAAVISHRFWKGHFHADPAIVGRIVNLNGLPFTISGVMPPSFFGVAVGRAPDVYVPLDWADRLQPGSPRLPLRNNFWLDVVGRLAPGASLPQAEAEADVLYRQANTEQTRELPPSHPLAQFLAGMRFRLSDGSRGVSELRDAYGRPLFILMAIVALVLLIACANVAALLLARATARRREFAVRLALGAGPGRLVRQFVAESLVIAIAGGALGLLFASWTAWGLVALLDQTSLDVSADPRVLAFTFVIAVLAGVLFGLVPAIQTRLESITLALRAGNGPAALRRFDLRGALVGAQVAISLLLVVGAGLFIRTLSNLQRMDTGIHADRVLLVAFNPSLNRYTPERTRQFYDDLLDRVAGLPGVTAASVADQPLLAGAAYYGVVVEGRVAPGLNAPPVALKTVTPRFFDTMGIALRRGRDFTARDRAGAPKVAIVNEKFVVQFLAGENPLGKRIGLGPAPDMEIVGVIADTKYGALRAPVPPTLYAVTDQMEQPSAARSLHVRSSLPPDVMAAAIRDQVRQLDRDLPASKVESFASIVDARLVRERLVATLSGCFGALALLLVSVGLYGAIAYSVQRRTREIGIRVSLGADTGTVVWMVMRRAFGVVLTGIAIGIPLAVWLSAFLKSLLFGVDPGDPPTIAGAAALLLLVAAIAAWLPARRAARVDPMVALRYE